MKLITLSFTSIAFLSFCVGATAEETTSKNAYIQIAKERLPTAFCSDGSYFRSCFKISDAECRAAATAATAACIDRHEHEMPQQLKHPQDTAGWGAKLGSCAGMIVETKLKDKQVTGERCKTPGG